MTPERLEEICLWHADNLAADMVYPGAETETTAIVGDLLHALGDAWEEGYAEGGQDSLEPNPYRKDVA